jgi:hypothetical protein
VATATFGSRGATEVRVLSSLRDEVLLRSPAGRALVDAYYRLSPSAADAVRGNACARAASRVALGPVVGASSLVLGGTWQLVLFGLAALAFAGCIVFLGRRSLRRIGA